MSFGWLVVAAFIGYGLGFIDGRYGKPVPPLKGNYEGCEDIREQDKEYPDDWD